ncbi:MAG: ABC transporter ATP-binding protein [Anaerotignum sp.]|nr:ABC transporter ATP-binding protein [Anaerotignum sp.]
MSEKKTILNVKDITMQFGGVVAVNNLTLKVREGEIVSLIGPNGAGKTTAFNVITGVYAPTNGEVKFHGETIISNYPKGKMDKLYAGENKGVYKKSIEPTPDKITKLGIARTFQNIRLFKELTVLENVLIAKHMRMKANIFADTFRLNRKEEKKMKEDSLELLKILDLYDVRDEIASSLPYGKQRHLEIARALATEPTLLLLDEPAAGLNPQETDELTAFIRDVRDKFNLTIFMIEHHMNLVMDISDWI